MVSEVAASLSLSNTTDLVDHVSTLPNRPAGNAIDPRFHMSFTFDTPELPITSCLMNALGALSELALGDFTGTLRPKTYGLPEYPTVSIVIDTTPTSDTIQTRFVIWGIWKGIRLMTASNTFRNALFTLTWERSLVGYVIFAQSGAGLGIAGSNSSQILSQKLSGLSTSNRPATSAANNDSASISGLDNDQNLDVSLTLLGPDLTIFEIFFTVFSTLASLAEYPKDQRLRAITLSPAGYDTTLRIFDPRRFVQKTVPILDSQEVVAAVAMIPRYMIQRSEFREVSLKLKVDGVLVGSGYLVKGVVGGDSSL